MLIIILFLFEIEFIGPLSFWNQSKQEHNITPILIQRRMPRMFYASCEYVIWILHSEMGEQQLN